MPRKSPEEMVDQIEKVVMYSRIGFSISPEDDECRFSAQEAVMYKFCKENNLEVKAAHRETASGILDLWSRPVLDKALKELKWSRKEKSVLLVSHAARLSKSCALVWRLLDQRNPKFLSVSAGMTYHRFPMQMQAAVAEEDFRLKYGSTNNRTSEEGYRRFARKIRVMIEMQMKDGMTLQEIAEESDKFNLPLPWDWHWNAETIQKIINLWD